MSSEKLISLQEKGIHLMELGYTCAEATLRVLLEEMGIDNDSCQWVTAGYMGAINSRKTICGILFGATVFLGYLQGMVTNQPPLIKNDGRNQAIQSVQALYDGFIERFHDTDCYTLTGCDWRNNSDVLRYFEEKVYVNTCYQYLLYAIEQCLDQITAVRG